MPRCPLCGSAHIVVTFRPQRRGHCFACDLQWGLDGGPAAATPETDGSPRENGGALASD